MFLLFSSFEFPIFNSNCNLQTIFNIQASHNIFSRYQLLTDVIAATELKTIF